MNWRAKLDGLKHAAFMATIDTIDTPPVGELGQAVQELIRTGDMTRLRECASGLTTQLGAYQPQFVRVYGWTIGLSRAKTSNEFRWHMSAKSHPPGRTPSEGDFQWLGKIAGYIGAPADPAIWPEDPTHVIHWSWSEVAN